MPMIRLSKLSFRDDAPQSRADMKLFGTDGIRGTANEFPITPEVALRAG